MLFLEELYMKEILRTIRDDILVITLFPEICYHLLLKQEMKDTKLSNYFNWVVGIVDDEK